MLSLFQEQSHVGSTTTRRGDRRCLVVWSSVALADPVSNAIANLTVDRGVFATHRVGNTLYFGGDFTDAAPRRNNTGSFVVLSPTTGGAVLTPRVSGVVESIVPDGTGG